MRRRILGYKNSIKSIQKDSLGLKVSFQKDISDFEIFACPTNGLSHEHLWHRDKLAALAPETFREGMIKVLKAILAGYETGKNLAIDG